MQYDAPVSAENVPAAHSSTTLVPLHAEPAGHRAQLVRVALVPPEVKEPSGHTKHSAALFELKRWSDPHSAHPPTAERNVPARQNEHCVAPALDVMSAAHAVQFDAPGSAENVPGAHSETTLVPSHAEPAGHGVQAVRVVWMPPEVKEPSGHTSQLGALFEL